MTKECKLNIVLIGSANVGKSVIFNNLTGLHQHIGNWPGKTVKKAEGTLYYNGYLIDIIDLPGIRSLSAYSLEEFVTREYILSTKLDFLINVIDATKIETGLILTLQLLELKKPMILVINMVDLLKKRGVHISYEALEDILGIPVIPVSAVYGKGLTTMLDRGINIINNYSSIPIHKYENQLEDLILILMQELNKVNHPYSKRFVAIKLLESDEEIEKIFIDKFDSIMTMVEELKLKIKKLYGYDSSIVIADARSILAANISKETIKSGDKQKISYEEILDNLTSHKILGYPFAIIMLICLFFFIFTGGNYIQHLFDKLSNILEIYFHKNSSIIYSIILSIIQNFWSILSLAISYIFPFYFLLFTLEDWGYLARIAYLMDHLMHKLGIHGKACIPLILGFGCNVTSCLGCRIMETHREKLITSILATFIPCNAVTIVIAGLVGKFLGTYSVISLYVLIFLLIFIIGKIIAIIIPGEPTELIMEMPNYRLPKFKNITKRTFLNIKEFIYSASPIVIISGIGITIISDLHALDSINKFISPLTTNWLMLPSSTGILLIFGILRKELILVLLASILHTNNFISVLNPSQIYTLSLVSTLYIPCAATIGVLYKELGWKIAMMVTCMKIILAIIIGGFVARAYNFFII